MGDTTMSGFVRVRAVSGPRHKFYAPVEWVAAHPELYVVIDKEPVSKPGPVEYAKSKRAASVVAAEPVDDHSAEVAPSDGVQSKENP